MRVDPRVVMVIIYLDQHAHPEQAAIDFMENLVKSLRGAQVVSDLMSTDWRLKKVIRIYLFYMPASILMVNASTGLKSC